MGKEEEIFFKKRVRENTSKKTEKTTVHCGCSDSTQIRRVGRSIQTEGGRGASVEASRASFCAARLHIHKSQEARNASMGTQQMWIRCGRYGVSDSPPIPRFLSSCLFAAAEFTLNDLLVLHAVARCHWILLFSCTWGTSPIERCLPSQRDAELFYPLLAAQQPLSS